jgi:hypothetical protein
MSMESRSPKMEAEAKYKKNKEKAAEKERLKEDQRAHMEDREKSLAELTLGHFDFETEVEKLEIAQQGFMTRREEALKGLTPDHFKFDESSYSVEEKYVPPPRKRRGAATVDSLRATVDRFRVVPPPPPPPSAWDKWEEAARVARDKKARAMERRIQEEQEEKEKKQDKQDLVELEARIKARAGRMGPDTEDETENAEIDEVWLKWAMKRKSDTDALVAKETADRRAERAARRAAERAAMEEADNTLDGIFQTEIKRLVDNARLVSEDEEAAKLNGNPRRWWHWKKPPPVGKRQPMLRKYPYEGGVTTQPLGGPVPPENIYDETSDHAAGRQINKMSGDTSSVGGLTAWFKVNPNKSSEEPFLREDATLIGAYPLDPLIQYLPCAEDWFKNRGRQCWENHYYTKKKLALPPVSQKVILRKDTFIKKFKDGKENFIQFDKILFWSPYSRGFYGLGPPGGSMLHLVVIPDNEHIATEVNSVRDLNAGHVEVLKKMKEDAVNYVKTNAAAYASRLIAEDVGKEVVSKLIGDNTEGTVDEGRKMLQDIYEDSDQWHFGFHETPTIGYLHMHVIIGPLTDPLNDPMGNRNEDHEHTNWVPFDALIGILKEHGSFRLSPFCIEEGCPGAPPLSGPALSGPPLSESFGAPAEGHSDVFKTVPHAGDFNTPLALDPNGTVGDFGKGFYLTPEEWIDNRMYQVRINEHMNVASVNGKPINVASVNGKPVPKKRFLDPVKKKLVQITKPIFLKKLTYEDNKTGFDVGGNLFHTKHSVGFYGLREPLASLLHLIVIPTNIGLEVNSVRDLNDGHFPTLINMAKDASTYIKMNTDAYAQRLATTPVGIDVAAKFKAMHDDLRDTSDKEVLQEIFKIQMNWQLGFHESPTVGYLHMHVLIGPLTKPLEGRDEAKEFNNWVPLDAVLDILEEYGSFRSSPFSIEKKGDFGASGGGPCKRCGKHRRC